MGGGGWQWATRARWVAHRGKKKVAFHSHGVGVGVGVPWQGQPANGWRKKRDTEGHTGVFTGGGGGIKRNWLLCCAGRERGTRWKRRRGVGTPGVTDEAKLAKQHTITPRNPAFSHHADDRPNRIPWLSDGAISTKATLLHPGHCVGCSKTSSIHLTIHPMRP